MQYRQFGPEGPSLSALGFGGMGLSITGRPPEEAAIQTIHAALDAGINFIDTANAYCLDDTEFNHNERLIQKALAGRSERVFVATKCACVRPGGAWRVDGRPAQLRTAAHASLKALGVDCLDLLQLHAPDARVPYEESVGALAKLREEGKVKYIGISNVTVSHIEQARRVTPIASVQNRWNALDRTPEKSGVLSYCTKHSIAFIPYSPFGGTREAPTLGVLGKIGAESRRRRMSPYRLILAWMLAKSPIVFPIPGARRDENITEAAKAADASFTHAEIAAIEAALPS